MKLKLKTEIFKKYRLKSGYTQKSFGIAIGRTRVNICKWENGTHQPPQELHGTIAKLLNIQEQKLFNVIKSS